MTRRDRHEIVIEILKKAKSGKLKTRIMVEVGLSYSQAKQYLSMLLERGALKIDENGYFKTTKKGLEFLEKCKECLLFKWRK